MTTDDDELQRWMARQLRSRRDLSTRPDVAARASSYFAPGPRLSPVEQLEVYRQQFWLRHTAALREDFPGLAALLEQQAWERVAEEYLQDLDLSGWSLRDLGCALPSFLQRQAWLPRRELCSDMAFFEWALLEAFDAADAEPITAAELARLPPEAWERARFQLHPALRLVRVSYPVADLLELLKSEQPLPDSIEPAPAGLAVHRQALSVCHESMAPAPFAVLEALAAGSTLIEACEAAVTAAPITPDALAAAVGGWFERWGRLGWVTRVSSAGAGPL